MRIASFSITRNQKNRRKKNTQLIIYCPLGNSQSLKSQSGLYSAIRNRLTTQSSNYAIKTLPTVYKGGWWRVRKNNKISLSHYLIATLASLVAVPAPVVATPASLVAVPAPVVAMPASLVAMLVHWLLCLSTVDNYTSSLN